MVAETWPLCWREERGCWGLWRMGVYALAKESQLEGASPLLTPALWKCVPSVARPSYLT